MSPKVAHSPEYSIDENKAKAIGETLLDQFYNKRVLFPGYETPEHTLPPNMEQGSAEHALFVTYVKSIEGMTNAAMLWSHAVEEYRVHPDHFQPEKILSMDDSTLTTIVGRVGARFDDHGAWTWKTISKALIERYDGDPRRVTENPSSVEEISKRISDFPYLEDNSFYLRAMGESKLFKIRDFETLDIPVGVNSARFTIYTGVLSLGSGVYHGGVREEPLRSLVEEAWREAAESLGTYPWKLDEPMWAIGSRLCRNRNCGLCPVNKYCDMNFHVVFRGDAAFWGPCVGLGFPSPSGFYERYVGDHDGARREARRVGLLMGAAFTERLGLGSGLGAVAAALNEFQRMFRGDPSARVEGGRVTMRCTGLCPVMRAANSLNVSWLWLDRNLALPMIQGVAAAAMPGIALRLVSAKSRGDPDCAYVFEVE